MMNNILGQFGLGGRLADNIRERQGMAYYAFSSFDPSVGQGPLWSEQASTREMWNGRIEAIDTEVRRLGKSGPTAVEVEETRAYLVGSIPRLLETNYSIAGFLTGVRAVRTGARLRPSSAGDSRVRYARRVASAAAEVLSPDGAAIAIAGPETGHEARP